MRIHWRVTLVLSVVLAASSGAATSLGADAPGATWPACDSAGSGFPDPEPVAQPSLDPALYPPPPASFRPETVRYVGTRAGLIGLGDPVWVAAIDGSGMRCASPAHGGVEIAAGGRVVYWDAIGPVTIADLLVRDPSGASRTVADRVDGFDIAARYAWVGRRSGTDQRPGADLGVWRVPIDGGTARRMLPPGERGTDDWIVGSADGRSVAVARYYAPGTGSGGPAAPIRVRFDGGPVQRVPYLVPIGFDARGRLVGTRGVDLVAYDPARARFVDLRLGRQGGIVTPRGRWIVAHPMGIPGSDGRSRLRAVRVGDGSRHAWMLAPGRWVLRQELSTDEFLVLQDPEDESRLAIVGLRDGWVGYLRFMATPAAAMPLADLLAACRLMPSCFVAQ